MTCQHRHFRSRGGLRFRLTVLAAVLALLLAACVDTVSNDRAADDTEDAAAAANGDASDDAANDEEIELFLTTLGFGSEEEAELPDVNAETFAAETPALSLQAQAWENAFVGEVTEELFIGIALDSAYAADAREVRVYVCDGQGIVSRFSAELEDGQAAMSDDDVAVELTVAEDEITGTVEPAGEASESFTAIPATDAAGIYVATDSVDDGDLWGGWIVLHDGRQRGAICHTAFGYTLCLLSVEGPAGKVARK